MIITNRCLLCGENQESTDHLLIQCEFSQIFWAALLSTLNVSRLPTSYNQVWDSWMKLPPIQKKSLAFEYLLVVGVWNLWKKYNSCIFHFSAMMPLIIAKQVAFILKSWMSITTNPNLSYMESHLDHLLSPIEI